MVDKIQTKVIDADSAPVKGSISNSDYVMIQNDSTKELEKVLVSDLLAGSAGSIRIKGEAQMDNASTTPTSIVVTGDPDDPTINQGVAPTDPSPNGAAYVVVTNNPNGVSTQITGETRTVFDSDQIVWTGSSWGIVEIGTRVQSVNGRVGNVTGLAEANNVYSKSEADTKFYSDTNKPTPAELGAVNKAGDTMTGPLTASVFKGRDLQDLSGTRVGYFGAEGGVGNYLGDVGRWLRLFAKDGLLQVFDQDSNIRRVYHQGFKPTATDVGALSSLDDTVWKYRESVANFDQLPATKPGHFHYSPGAVSAPTTEYGHGFVSSSGFTAGRGVWGTQFAFSHTSNKQVYFRNFVNALPSGEWIRFYTTSDKPTLTELGALGATATAVNSEKLEGSTKAQVIADARTGLELAGTAYSKGESDARYKPIGYVPAWGDITGIPVYATRWPTKAEVGLSNVPNYTITNATNDPSTTKFASAAAVSALNDYVKSKELASSRVNDALVGSIVEFPPLPAGKTPHSTYVPMNGTLLDRTEYQALWLWANNMGLVVSESEWQSIKSGSHGGAVSVYSSASGNNFRVPDVGTYGMVSRQMGNTRPSESDRVKGHTDQNKAHTHTRGSMEIIGNFGYTLLGSGGYGFGVRDAGGAFYADPASATENWALGSGLTTSLSKTGVNGYIARFQASRSWTGNTSSEGGSEVTMKYMWCSKWIYSGK